MTRGIIDRLADWLERPMSGRVHFTRLTLVVVLVCSLAAFATVTQIDAAAQLKGIVAIVNGGTGTSSTLAGLVRGSASAMTAAELSGDATTSGSNAVTVAKVNGTSVPTNAAADQVLITTASATGAWKTVPDCQTGAIQYTASTHTITCGVMAGALNFADAETPTGTINGVNATFTLAHTPNPAASLKVYRNGQLMTAGVGNDFTLSTATITALTTSIPKTGDTYAAYYRY